MNVVSFMAHADAEMRCLGIMLKCRDRGDRLVHHCAMQAVLPVLPTQTAPLAVSPAIFQCEPFGTFNFPASYYVDISAYHAEKAHLLLNHISQESAMQAAVGSGLGQLCARTESFRGQQVGCAWAESFIPMPGGGTIKPYPVLL